MTRWTQTRLVFLAVSTILVASLCWRNRTVRQDGGVSDMPVKIPPSGQVATPSAGSAAQPARARPRPRPPTVRRNPSRAARKDVAAPSAAGTAAVAEAAAQSSVPAVSSSTVARSAPREQAVKKWEAFVDQITERKTPPEAGQMEQFKNEFMRLHADDQVDAIQNALNLLPDEQFVSLFAILFDKTQNPDVLDEIFNDALNRPEEIKVPMMKALLRDKGHPLHDEAARILDATGEGDADDGNGAEAATP